MYFSKILNMQFHICFEQVLLILGREFHCISLTALRKAKLFGNESWLLFFFLLSAFIRTSNKSSITYIILVDMIYLKTKQRNKKLCTQFLRHFMS